MKLIVGLGNPGEDYQLTRHNAGVWFVEQLAESCGVTFHSDKKFQGLWSDAKVDRHDCRLLLPQTFMNHSGRSVLAMMQFFKLTPQQILIVHDELDLPAGVVRLKQGGGHGGHNGLRDVITQLGTDDFYRLRIGIAHPGKREQVLSYVLGRPTQEDRMKIQSAIDTAINVVSSILAGHVDKAMQQLHSEGKNNGV